MHVVGSAASVTPPPTPAGRLRGPCPAPGDELGCPLKRAMGRGPVTSGEHCVTRAAPGEAVCAAGRPVRGPDQGTRVSADPAVTSRAWWLWVNASSVTSVMSTRLRPQNRRTCPCRYLSWSRGEGRPRGCPPCWWPSPRAGGPPCGRPAACVARGGGSGPRSGSGRRRRAGRSRVVITFVPTGAPERQRGRGWQCRAPEERRRGCTAFRGPINN